MIGWKRAMLIFAVAVGGGCQKQTEIPDGSVTPSSPAPSTTTGSGEPNVRVIPPAPASSPASEDDVAALAKYNDALAPIIREWDTASIRIIKEVTAAKPEFEKVGPSALLPAYEHYAQASEHVRKAIDKLKPPVSAKRFHLAWESVVTRMDENLDQTVASLHSEGGDDAAKLIGERKKIKEEGAAQIAEAIRASGFNLEKFTQTGRLTK